MASEAIKFRQEHRRKRRLREITTHIVLLLIVIMYSYLGATLFQSIEEKHEQRAKGNLIKSKHDFLDRIQVRFDSSTIDRKNWTKMVDRLLNYYVEDLAEATSHGVDITDVSQHEYESASKWDFWGSLFYAGTVYTTIGYGNFAPVTPEGKIATIIYGTVGIPLCLILLADLGNLIAKLIKYSVKKVKKQWYTTSKSKKNLRELWPPQDEIDSMSGKSSFVVLCVVSLLYFTFGTVMYRSWEEDWSYLDSVYFIFVSTSTIGFGDVLPSQPKKFIFTSFYIFFGLSLLSSGFTIIQDLLENRITEAKSDLDSALGIKKTEQEPATPSEAPTTSAQTTPTIDKATHDNDESLEKIPEKVETIPIVEECIVQKSVNNNLETAPTSSFKVPIESKPFSRPTSGHPGSDLKDPQVSETRLISLDDGVLSVEATIILD